MDSLPDVSLPLRFLLFGVLSFLVGIGWLIARPELLTTYHYHQHVAAVTHLFILGFMLSVVMGAIYQLVPVALETRLHSERVARWHFPIHVIGVAGMVWMFWVWDMKNLGHFGTVLAIGAGMFIWNIVQTLRQVRGWTVISFGIASVLFWLGAVITAGLAIAAAKSTYELADRPDLSPLLSAPLLGLKAVAQALSRFDPIALMHAHAHLGVLGVFVLLTSTVAFKLVPMFLIGEVQSPARAWVSVCLLNLGTLGLFFGILLQSALKPLAACVVIAGLAVYGWELAAIIRARRRPAIDWGLRAFITSQLVLAPVAILGLFLSWPTLSLTEFVGRLENAYGFAVLLGVIAFAIMGMLYKILPFLVWFAAYGASVGRAKTPALHEMYSSAVQAWGYYLWLAGLVTTLTGVLVASELTARLGAGLLAASLATFAVNCTLVLRHLVRRPQSWSLQNSPSPVRP